MAFNFKKRKARGDYWRVLLSPSTSDGDLSSESLRAASRPFMHDLAAGTAEWPDAVPVGDIDQFALTVLGKADDATATLKLFGFFSNGPGAEILELSITMGNLSIIPPGINVNQEGFPFDALPGEMDRLEDGSAWKLADTYAALNDPGGIFTVVSEGANLVAYGIVDLSSFMPFSYIIPELTLGTETKLAALWYPLKYREGLVIGV